MKENMISELNQIVALDNQMKKVINQYWLSWQDFQYADGEYVDRAIERLEVAEEMVLTYMPDAIRFLPSLHLN